MYSSSSEIKVRFLIDKKQERVVFAEAGGEFVDVLFSFFTLPLGRIATFFDEDNVTSSLYTLYRSVLMLDVKHLQTEACKEMLLTPRSAIALQCEDLKINITHDKSPRTVYTCRGIGCLIKTECYYTFTSGGLCSRCGKPMDNILNLPKEISGKGGVFVNETDSFMITDDLQVMPISLSKTFSLLEKLQIKDGRILEERVIYFDTSEVLNLLERSFESKNVLTDICFSDDYLGECGQFYLPSEKGIAADNSENKIVLKLFLNKNNNNVLYAEVGEDFVNLLYSFLTFPLATVFGLFSDGISSFGGCLGNLYSSIKNMDSNCFKSEICRNMLQTPKLSAFYGIKNLILDLEENKPTESTVLMSCVKCYLDNECNTCTSAPCAHGLLEAKFIEQNPKKANGVTNNGGCFVAGSKRFIVSDSFEISPLSAISAVLKRKYSLSDVVEVEVVVDRGKALSLLSAMMMSNQVLTDVFSPELKRRRKSM